MATTKRRTTEPTPEPADPDERPDPNRDEVPVALVADEYEPKGWWMEDGGAHWINSNGGFRPKSAKDVVRRTATIRRGEWASLDWSDTGVLKSGSPYGWVDPDGVFFGCGYMMHDAVCAYVFKAEVGAIELTHVRITAMNDYTGPWGGKMTRAQRRTLERRGFTVEDEFGS